MRYLLTIIALCLLIQLQSVVLSQDPCMPVSKTIKDINITFNFPGCDMYHYEQNYSELNQNHSLMYGNDIDYLKVAIERKPNQEPYAIEYGLWTMLGNCNSGKPTDVIIDGLIGKQIVGTPNVIGGRNKIVLSYKPIVLGSKDLVCTIETNINESSFANIVKSFKIK